MTTKEAFEQLIHERVWYADLGLTRLTANSIASRFRSGKLTIEKMEELLEKAGFRVKQEKQWEK